MTLGHALIDVRDFHMAAGQPVLFTPQIPSPERMELRYKLIKEESTELLDEIEANNLAGIAKEGFDLIYVILGTMLECGIPIDLIWDELHNSNMAKRDPETGKFLLRSDGKVLKPDGWVKPDVEALLIKAQRR